MQSLDAFGRELTRPRYDAWGRLYRGSGISRDTGLGYTGHFEDRALGLIDMGYRWYDPMLRRFTSQDPIRDGANWYAYCGNDPVNFVDRLGLCGEKKTETSPQPLINDDPTVDKEYGPKNGVGKEERGSSGNTRVDTNDTVFKVDYAAIVLVSDGIDENAMLRPAEGQVTSEFGKREVIQTTKGPTRPGHGGIDIANAEGTPIFSAFHGYVLDSGYSRDYGNYIIIGKERNNWSAMYAIYGHLKERTDEATGDFMYAGMYIGPMGSTGRSTGPHLHFEIRVAGEKVNPRSFIQF